MKKILFSLFLFFLTTNSSFGDILLKQCWEVQKDNSVKNAIDERRHEYYISFDDGKVYFTYVSSRATTDFLNEKRDEVGLKSQSRTTNEVYAITFLDEKILTAELNETDETGTSLLNELEIDFETNRVSKFVYGTNERGKKVEKWLRGFYKETYGRPFSLLQCVNENQESSGDASGSSGTAFFISNKGHLLTNNHVVEGCEQSKINFKNKDYDAKLIATDKTLDLALLKANIRSSTYFSFSNEVQINLTKFMLQVFLWEKG